MSEWLDPSGHSNYGIGLCDRCHQKFPLDMLFPDPNTPGLRVCAADLDVYDPYRLPARQVENIALPYTRPDEPLTFDVNNVPNSERPPGDFLLSGSGSPTTVNLSWTLPSETVSGYNIYRSTDSGAFIKIGSTVPSVRAYTDATVDRNNHVYQYYATYIEAAFGIESLPSNTVTMVKISAVVMISCATANPKCGRSTDGGLTWSLVPAPTFPLPVSGTGATGCQIVWARERGRLVAVSQATVNSNIAYSDDLGQTWTLVNKGNSLGVKGVFYANWLDAFFAWGFVDGVHAVPMMRSTDGGVTWGFPTTTGAGNQQNINGMAAIPELQIIIGFVGNQLLYSFDGLAWVNTGSNTAAQPHGEPGNWRNIYNYSPTLNRFVWGGTSNGHFWYLSNPNPPGAAVDTTFSNGGSNTCPMAWSPVLNAFYSMDVNLGNFKKAADGIAWANNGATYPTDYPLSPNDMIWCRSSNLFIAVGQRNFVPGVRGRISTSPDFLTWTTQIPAGDPDTNTNWGSIVECF